MDAPHEGGLPGFSTAPGWPRRFTALQKVIGAGFLKENPANSESRNCSASPGQLWGVLTPAGRAEARPLLSLRVAGQLRGRTRPKQQTGLPPAFEKSGATGEAAPDF